MDNPGSEKKKPRSNVKAFIIILVESTVLSLILVVIIKIPSVQEVLLEIIFPENPIIIFPYNLIGLLMGVLGFALIIWANYTLLQKISIEEREPFHTPSALVLNGPFQFSRNPVYLSVIIIALGFAIFFGSLILFIFPPIFFIVFNRFLIRWEEKTLEEAFGEEYLNYKRHVRRWI
ncbi:MAG: methyltransferase family protein [Candidatus Hodarchaeales archaeon]|jgi:protein-S-isoprenylcysteine O-methyltransferase Ste14